MNKNTAYTWEEMEERRAALKQQLEIKGQRIEKHCNQLFAAPETETPLDKVTNYAKMGFSIYDGFMTGFKLLKTFGVFFPRKSHKK